MRILRFFIFLSPHLSVSDSRFFCTNREVISILVATGMQGSLGVAAAESGKRPRHPAHQIESGVK
jgi:hypothetical protein